MAKQTIKREFPRFLPEFACKFETQAELQEYYNAYFPAGSGPLGTMRVVCALLEKITLEKGFTLKKPGEE